MSDHLEFLARQCAVGRLAFGPGQRKLGVLDHMTKEMEEVRNAPDLSSQLGEWVDLVMLAQDGLLRCAREQLRRARADALEPSDPSLEPTNSEVASVALRVLTSKRNKNELREWGDWCKLGEDVAIEHKRGLQD